MEQERDRQPGGQERWPQERATDATQGDEMALHEERARIEKETRERVARVSKHVTEEPVHQEIPREIEEAEVERATAGPEDSGEVEVLPNGSLSIPIMEEEVIVTKRTIVRERIIVRKHVRTEQAQVDTTVRRERAVVEDVPDNDFPMDQRAAS